MIRTVLKAMQARTGKRPIIYADVTFYRDASKRDRLLLSKTDLISDEEQVKLKERLVKMNPRAPMRSTVCSPDSRARTCSASAGSAPAHSGCAVGKTSVECIAVP